MGFREGRKSGFVSSRALIVIILEASMSLMRACTESGKSFACGIGSNMSLYFLLDSNSNLSSFSLVAKVSMRLHMAAMGLTLGSMLEGLL